MIIWLVWLINESDVRIVPPCGLKRKANKVIDNGMDVATAGSDFS
jgi:hypothetical protein